MIVEPGEKTEPRARRRRRVITDTPARVLQAQPIAHDPPRPPLAPTAREDACGTSMEKPRRHRGRAEEPAEADASMQTQVVRAAAAASVSHRMILESKGSDWRLVGSAPR